MRHPSVAAYEQFRRGVEADVRSALDTPLFKQQVNTLRQLMVRGAAPATQAQPALSRAANFMQQHVHQSMTTSLFQRAEVADIVEHVADGVHAAHPEEGWGRTDGTPAALRASVAQLCAWRGDTRSRRHKRWAAFEAVAAKLDPLTERVMGASSPQHIRCAVGRPMHVALVAAAAAAMGIEPNLAVDCACGFRCVGDLRESGRWRRADPVPEEWADWTVETKQPPDPELLDRLDHAQYNARLLAQVAEEGRAAEAAGGRRWDEVRAVFAATVKEVDKGLMDGFFDEAALDAMYGPGAWRAMKRFGVWQRGKCRACDNAKASLHNRGTLPREKPSFDRADFPARVAALFADAGVFAPLEGGTDDVMAAYRRVMTALPQFTVVALYHPERRQAVLCTLPGFNFGLVSAVHAFNRISAFAVDVMRAFFAWAGNAFFDDFITVEPTFAKRSGQAMLWRVMRRLGVPLADEKHVPMAPRFVYLGVRSDLSQFHQNGYVRVGVESERCARIAETVEAHVESGAMSEAEASKLGGRLAFATEWAAMRFGRALMQPLYERMRDGAGGIRRALAMTLVFFAVVLRQPGGLPGRLFKLRGDGAPTAKIWTDAAWEPDEATPATVAFVVYMPDERQKSSVPLPPSTGAQPKGDLLTDAQRDVLRALPAGRWITGMAEVPPAIMRRFCERQTYIGQLELVAAAGVYASVPELAERRCVHWVDNQGAIAALIKGYASAVDSVRIVHAYVLMVLRMGVAVWFMFVPSRANIADLPSRHRFEMLRELGAEWRDFVFPAFAAWDEPVEAWLERVGGGERVREGRWRGGD